MGKQFLIALLLGLLVSLVAVHPVLAATITNPTSISVIIGLLVREQKPRGWLWSNPLFTLYLEIGPSHMKQ